MAESEEERAAARVDAIVSRLLRDRSARITPGDAGDRGPLLAAGLLAGARLTRPRMSPEFRRRLAGRIAGAQPRRLSRRAALVAGVAAAGGAALGIAAERLRGGTAGSLLPGGDPTGDEEAPRVLQPAAALARWVDSGLVLADLVEGQPNHVVAGAIQAFVVRRGSGVTAMSAVCTHQACTLRWMATESVLDCPCHGQRFTLGGRPLPSAAEYPLPSLPRVRVRVREGRIEVLGTA
jgi:Rieske Fe-S protein